MSWLQYQQQYENELLNSNIENVCHELEGLLLNNEPSYTDSEGAIGVDFGGYDATNNASENFWKSLEESQIRRQQHMEEIVLQKQQEQLEQERLQKIREQQQTQQYQLHHQQQQFNQQQQQLHQQHFFQQECPQEQLRQQQIPLEQQQIHEQQQFPQQLQCSQQLPKFDNFSNFPITPNHQAPPPSNADLGFVDNQSILCSAIPINTIMLQPSFTSVSNINENPYSYPSTLNKFTPNPNAIPKPLISAATSCSQSKSDNRHNEKRGVYSGSGAYRKQTYKYNHKQSVVKDEEEIDWDNVEINLEELGITTGDIYENYPVLQLMTNFRLLNHYLQDVFPYVQYKYGIKVEPTPIPQSMNIKFQVKHAARNCTVFLCSKERIINDYKLVDRENYEECEKSIHTMRKLLAELEPYKRIDFEHKRCQFLTEKAKASANSLKLLLEKLSDQVRECNLYVHVFEWSAKMKLGKNLDSDQESVQASTMTGNYDEENGGDDDDGNEEENENEHEMQKEGLRVRRNIRFIGC